MKLAAAIAMVTITTSAMADPLQSYRGPYGGDPSNRDIRVYQAYAQTKNNGLPLTAIIQTGALAYSSQNAFKNNNPYALLGVASAATSILPSMGYNQTVSGLINNVFK